MASRSRTEENLYNRLPCPRKKTPSKTAAIIRVRSGVYLMTRRTAPRDTTQRGNTFGQTSCPQPPFMVSGLFFIKILLYYAGKSMLIV